MMMGSLGNVPAVYPGKATRYPFYRGENSPPPGFDPRTVQSVASRYTDWAMHIMLHTLRPHNLQLSKSKFLFKNIVAVDSAAHFIVFSSHNGFNSASVKFRFSCQ